jgi:hypothetical protein
MQNLPDKGVSGSLYHLKANYTVTGLTDSACESQGGNERNQRHFPFWAAVMYVASWQRAAVRRWASCVRKTLDGAVPGHAEA